MSFQNFDNNYKKILENIESAAEKSGRNSEDITLLAATKTVSAELINHAIDSGIKYIGENRVQEFLDKYEKLNREYLRCHFIGRLQSNKVKYIIDKVSMIQSVDSIKLAEKIGDAAQKANKVMDILVEVNIGNESSKAGVAPESLYEFIDEAREIKGIKISGLMTIPPITDKIAAQTDYFARMRQYYVDITAKNIDNVVMNCLSMGMSDDYDLAIEQGANMVRIGSSLFGERL